VAAAVALLVGAAVPLLPLVRADYALDQAVRAVALDWRDFGRERAEERLALEMAAPSVASRVRPGACSLVEGTPRAVRCQWGVTLQVPLVHRQIPLSFASEALLGADGSLQ
jgi:hypothetical protein